jgi:beta-glucanase (GH16 family)
MFHYLSEPAVQPYVALVGGTLFIAIIRSLASNDYSLNTYKRRFISRRKKLTSAIKGFFRGFKKLAHISWPFFSGAAFATIVFVAFTLFSGAAYSHDSAIDSVASALSIHSASRTVIDTSKPWVYDFSKLPNGPIDTKIFNLENGPTTASYNNEAETYTNRTDNVRVQDGTLVIEAQPESRDGKDYTSGRIDTNGSFSFIYGTLEVEAKLPRGVGTWPAAWLMPSEPRYLASDFPSATDQTRIYTLNGELDFLESVGYLPGQNIPAAHSYDSLGQAAQYTPGFISDPYDGYHSYGIIKTPSSIEFTIDGNVYASRQKTGDDPLSWPFDQPYYLILNLALGGTWAGKDGIDDSSAPWEYMIKSITYTPPTTAQLNN